MNKLIAMIVVCVVLSACSTSATKPDCVALVQNDTSKIHLNLPLPPPIDTSPFTSVKVTVVQQNGQATEYHMSERDYSSFVQLINTLDGRIELLQDYLTQYKNFYETDQSDQTTK